MSVPLRILGRSLAVIALALVASVLWLPIHEYTHCAAWWARGSKEDCTVTYARPGSDADYAGYAVTPDGSPEETAKNAAREHAVLDPLEYVVLGLVVVAGAWWILRAARS